MCVSRARASGAGVTEPEVLAAGTINADSLLCLDAALQTGVSLIARRLLRTSGGRAGNVSVMVRRLGRPARLCGCVGIDDLAEQALRGPRAAGVELELVRRAPADTGFVAILVGEGATKTMVMAPGANAAFDEEDGARLAGEVRRAPERSVLVVDSELEPTALVAALEAARSSGHSTVLDPTRPGRVTDRLLELSDHVTPNSDEAARMTGTPVQSPEDAHRAARRLRDRGARNVHVRLPRGGCLTLWPDGEALVTTPADLEAVDSTGAGDAFAGTLATAIIDQLPPVVAARLAAAAAACAVARLGAQESYPDPSALEAVARRVRAAIYP